MTERIESLETPIVLPTHRLRYFDPPSELADYREHQPLRRLSYPDGHIGWLVTNYELSRGLLRDLRLSSIGELQRLPVRWPARDKMARRPAPEGFFIRMDPPDHTRFRRMLTGEFTVRRMNDLRPGVEAIVKDELDKMEDGGKPADLAIPCQSIPSLVICEMLGVPVEDRDEFQHYGLLLSSLESSPDEGADSMQATLDFLRRLIDQKRASPGNDMLSRLVDSPDLTDEELAGVGTMLLLAGHETTANMLSLGTFALLTHAEQLKRLVDDMSLLDNAIEELLRYLSILQYSITRTALEDVEIDGLVVKEGETVTISLPAANRDPDKFEDPDELDISRAERGHLAFGHGVHQCIGQQLARIEMEVSFRELLTRFPTLRLAVDPDEVPLRHDMAVHGVHSLPVTWDDTPD